MGEGALFVRCRYPPIKGDKASGRLVVRTVALFGLLIVTACSDSLTGPTTVSPPSTNTFNGKVYPQGSTTWSFAMTAPGTLDLTLTNVDPAGLVLGMSLGEHSSLGCSVTNHIETKAGLSAQITAPAHVGDHCIQVYDTGGVGLSGASFSVSIHAF
jgi:hypothetical protein